jgi:DNA-binding CsgD family transcriptional regulator
LSHAAPADAGGARPRAVAVVGGAFALIALLVGADVALDLRAGTGAGHAALELGVVAVALAAAGVLAWHLVRLRRSARLLARDLGVARADAARWQREAEGALRGLGEAIDRQFERWALSAAEREVALLLLKGLAHKEIAGLRATSERTVRQQSLAVYRKAGLSGRAELSAFFLEDLLLPGTPRPPGSSVPPERGSPGRG